MQTLYYIFYVLYTVIELLYAMVQKEQVSQDPIDIRALSHLDRRNFLTALKWLTELAPKSFFMRGSRVSREQYKENDGIFSLVRISIGTIGSRCENGSKSILCSEQQEWLKYYKRQNTIRGVEVEWTINLCQQSQVISSLHSCFNVVMCSMTVYFFLDKFSNVL